MSVLGLGLGPSCCRRSARMRHEMAQAGLQPWHGRQASSWHDRRASSLGKAWADAGHARRPWNMRALPLAGGLLTAPPLTEVICGAQG